VFTLTLSQFLFLAGTSVHCHGEKNESKSKYGNNFFGSSKVTIYYQVSPNSFHFFDGFSQSVQSIN
jgi:hypothetical protein